jgi:hypothetical protein
MQTDPFHFPISDRFRSIPPTPNADADDGIWIAFIDEGLLLLLLLLLMVAASPIIITE